MASWLGRLSIRRQILLLTLAIALPAGVMIAWLVAAEALHAREVDQQNLRNIAEDAAAVLGQSLRQSKVTLERLAARPLLRIPWRRSIPAGIGANQRQWAGQRAAACVDAAARVSACEVPRVASRCASARPASPRASARRPAAR